MKTIPSIVASLLLLNVLAAQQTGQPANPAVSGGTTLSSATTGALGMPEVPGVGGGGFGSGTAALGSLPLSNDFAIALLSEEAEQDLASAAAAYRRTIQAFDRQRTEAANAIFRLGEVYRKMGRIEEAKVQYARILREFPDMVRLTELSHGLLLGEEGRAATVRGQEAPTIATDPAADARTGPVTLSPDVMARYGLGAGSQTRPDRYGLATGPSLDPALAARYGITVPSPSPAPTAGRESERIACVSNLKQLGLAA